MPAQEWMRQVVEQLVMMVSSAYMLNTPVSCQTMMDPTSAYMITMCVTKMGAL